jgi:hypothetical protein
MLARMYMHFSNHPIPEVEDGMTKRLEKCWKDCDQLLFILALILNPFECLLCFGEKAEINHFKCNSLLILVCVLYLLTDRLCRCIDKCKAIPVMKIHQMCSSKRSGPSLWHLCSTSPQAAPLQVLKRNRPSRRF